MLIYFVRHGQTDDNLNGIIQGHKDTPLNDQGRRESARLAQRLQDVPFVEAWSSTLSRARETAEIAVAPHEGLILRTDQGLMERSLGSLEGRRRLRGEPLPRDVEPSEVFRARIVSWFKAFLARHAPHDTTTTINGSEPCPGPQPSPSFPDSRPILIVSHGAYLTALLPLLLNPSKVWDITPGPHADLGAHCLNTSIMRVRLRPPDGSAKWSGMVESWGDVQHLEGLDEEDLDIADDVR